VEPPPSDSTPSSSEILSSRLFRIVHLSDDALAKGLAPYGLQPGWFDLLAALRRAGAPYELNPTHLMRTTLLSSSGMTKRLDRMEAAGLIERRPLDGLLKKLLIQLERAKRTS
jgi:DNA-binding MarR family transcriptional regulator